MLVFSILLKKNGSLIIAFLKLKIKNLKIKIKYEYVK